MLRLPDEADVLARLVAWGEAEPAIRVMVLTSSRARQDGSADPLSDYDVILAVRDAAKLAADDEWSRAYGRPLVRWGDQHDLYGLTAHFRGVVYEDGVKVDYTLWPEALVAHVAGDARLPAVLDVGYRVLLDKDGGTAQWRPPTYRAHVPTPPSEAEYLALVEEFWWGTTYVAKALWRGEIVFAKWLLDAEAKFLALRRLLEWRLEIDRDWSLRPGAYGRGLEELVPPDTWAELRRTYVGTEIEDNWVALFGTAALFRRVATEVGDALGFSYPRHVDERVTEHLERVRQLRPKD